MGSRAGLSFLFRKSSSARNCSWVRVGTAGASPSSWENSSYSSFFPRQTTLIYLQKNGLTDLGELERACDTAVQKFNDLSDQMKAAEQRMNDISELQRNIGTYSKTREIYAQYRKLTGRKREKFYEQHCNEITACQAAKRYFDSLGLKKLPSIQSLKQEYAMLQAENKKRYPEYKQAREKMIELLTAKNNVERILGVTEKEKNRSRQQEPR